MEIRDWINIIAVLLSPIIAVVISLHLTKREEKRKEKMEVFKQLMVSRAISGNYDYVRTLNSLDVVFADSPKVRQAWKELYNEYANSNSNNIAIISKRTKLIVSVAEDLGYSGKIEWNEIIENPYIPNWLVDDWKQTDIVREGQREFVDWVKNATQNLKNTENNASKEGQSND